MLLLSVPSAAIVHELCKRVDVRLICCLNFLGFAVTLTWLGLFDKTASFDQIAWPMTFLGFSLAMFFAPLANLAMDGLQGAQLMRAAEEFVLLRTVAGGFGIALQGVVLFRRTPYHALDLSDQFSGRRFSELDLMTQLTDKLEPLGFTPAHGDQSGRALSAAGGGAAGARTTPFCSAPSYSSASPPSFGWPAPPIRLRLTAAQELKQLTAQELMEQI